MAPNLKLHFFDAKDINGSVLHEITDEDDYFKKLTLKLERDGLGGAELILARKVGFAGFGSGTFNPEVFVRIIISAYSDTIYYPWGFFLDKRQQTVVHVEEDGSEEFHFGGPGPKQYLDRSALGIEQLTGTGWNLDLENGVWRWNESATVGRVLNRIYQEDQARTDPALPDLTLGFDADDDSDGNPWTDDDLGGPDQFELPIGHSLLDSLWDVDDVVELTSWIELGTVATPVFELNVAEGLGADKTGSAVGAGVCLLKEGLNIANKALVTEGHSLKKASHVIVEGKDGNWAEAVRPGFSSGDYVKYVKISYTRSNSDFWLEKAGIRYLKRQDYGEKELTVEIVPGTSDATGFYFPAPNRNLWLSNLISVDTSADGMTHTPLDIQPSEDQLVTGLLLETHTASDDSSAAAKAMSWDVSVVMNRERPGNVQKAPDQKSAASGGGDCKCLKLCAYSGIFESNLTDWKVLEHASLASGDINPEPADWKEVGFDDTAWSLPTNAASNPSVLRDIMGPNSGNFLKRHEFFFRREVWIPQSQIDAGGSVRLQFYADDGGTVYVNGVSVASRGTQWNAGPGLLDTTVAVSSFVAGLNCIAIYLWNQETGTDGTAPNPGGTICGLQIDILNAEHDLGTDGNAAHCDHVHHASVIPITDLAGNFDSDNVEGALAEAATGGAGAPPTADYLVGTAQGGLSAEIVVGTTPGGELGGTWASPTVDATHSGSTHDAATNTHIADSSDAHDASAISVADAGGFYTGTEVEAVLQEIGPGLAAGLLGNHTHTINGTGATGGGGVLNTPDLEATGLFKISGVITSTVDANQNDYNPTGMHTNGVIRFTSFTANRTITGLNAGSDGEILILINNTGFSLTLPNESASSSALNRLRIAGGVSTVIRTSGGIILMYLAGRWTGIGQVS